MLAEVLAALKGLAAIPAMIDKLDEIGAKIANEIKEVKIDRMEKELNKIRSDVDETLAKIKNARTNEDRARLADELNSRIRK